MSLTGSVVFCHLLIVWFSVTYWLWFYVTYWQCGILSLTDCVVFCHLLTVWFSVTYWLCGFLSLTDSVVFCHLLTVWFSVTYWQCGFSFYCWRWAILFYLFLLFQQYYMYIICWLNRTLSKPKTCLNQTHFTVPSTKCLCNFNLSKPNTCLKWTNSTVPKGFSLDRFHCCIGIHDSNMILNKHWSIQSENRTETGFGLVVMVSNATFNNISVISRQSVSLVEETGVPRKKQPTCC